MPLSPDKNPSSFRFFRPADETPSARPTPAEIKSLLESIPVEFEPGQLEFLLPKEILEVAAEIADGSDVVGLERARLERLVRVVIAMDRARVGGRP